jgi:serine phosphatase RsbU (regulator of sigma subunit)
MSMLGISLLNEIVTPKERKLPADLLDELRQRIKQSMHQTGQEKEQQDGIDMAFCMIDLNSLTMTYAGAYHPLYVCRNHQLIIFKADRMPIGIHPMDEVKFTNHQLTLQDGDAFYLFSDGYISQIGGIHDKKFKTRKFQDLLLKNYEKPMPEQKEILRHTIEEWKGELQQIDDYLVIGVRIDSIKIAGKFKKMDQLMF